MNSACTYVGRQLYLSFFCHAQTDHVLHTQHVGHLNLRISVNVMKTNG